MSFARWKDKLTRFGQLDGADKWLLLRAAAWLAVARIMLAVLSFRRLSARLSARNVSSHTEADPEVSQRIGRAVAVAANNVPWRSDCFPQTIAARMLLKRHGYSSVIHFGVEKIGDNELGGHAWLTCGDTVVIGGTNLDCYTELHHLET